MGFDDLCNTPERNEKCVHKTVVRKFGEIVSDTFIYMTKFYGGG
jgi:hypothetical protein